MIARFEGCRLKAYPDPGTGGEPWTIGYGATHYLDGRKVHHGETISQEQAEEMLREEVSRTMRKVESFLMRPATATELAALTSFAYNVGTAALHKSTLLRKFNNGDLHGAAEEFMRWTHAGGHVLKGLVTRRHEESELFEGVA
jgi:lysozyme